MIRKKKQRERSERGSATVEAVVAFTGFLMVIFTILNVVNYCRAQMLISNAMDTAAKELSQYAYFYKMSGLQKFDKAVKDNSDIGAKNLDGVIGTVDGLYKSMTKMKEDGIQEATKITNAFEGKANVVETVKNTLTTMDTDVTNIDTNINSVMSAVVGVGDDPILYMKSIIAVAGNESIDLLKSHVIAAPLAKLFFVKHFGESFEEANEKLKQLGVKDGLDGMNFKMSSVFSSEEPENIHLAVYYKLQLAQFFKGLELEVPICKESVTRAWLGGDNVVKKVKPEVNVSESLSNRAEQLQEEENKKEPGEPEKNKEPVNTEGSFWYLTEKDAHGYNEKSAAFHHLLLEQTDVDSECAAFGYYGRDSDHVAYSMSFCTDAEDITSTVADAFTGLLVLAGKEKEFIETNGEKGYEPGSTEEYCVVIYVPENIPEEEMEKLRSKVNSELDGIVEDVSLSESIELDFPLRVDYRKAGGNYDYSDGGGT